MLSIKDNKIRIKFNKCFYKKTSIEETKKAYSRICTIAIMEKKDYYYVNLVPNKADDDLNKLGLEFANYVLFLQK